MAVLFLFSGVLAVLGLIVLAIGVGRGSKRSAGLSLTGAAVLVAGAALGGVGYSFSHRASNAPREVGTAATTEASKAEGEPAVSATPAADDAETQRMEGLLARLADRGGQWSEKDALALQSAFFEDKLTDGQEQRYLDHLIAPVLRLRKSIGQQDPFVVWIEPNARLSKSSYPRFLLIWTQVLSVVLDDGTVLYAEDDPRNASGSGLGASGNVSQRISLLEPPAPGPHSATVTVQLQLGTDREQGSPPRWSKVVSQEIAFTAVEGSSIAADRSITPQEMMQRVSIVPRPRFGSEAAAPEPTTSLVILTGRSERVEVGLRLNKPGTFLAFTATAEIEGKTLPLGERILPPKSDYVTKMVARWRDVDPHDFHGKTATIRITAKPEMAANDLDAESAWEGELVFENVPVQVIDGDVQGAR